MATQQIARVENIVLTFVKVVRFMTVNVHIPCKPGQAVTVEQNGEMVTGYPVYKGAVWMTDAKGNTYVSFVKKSTKLWQATRVAEAGAKVEFKSFLVKEVRAADEHGPERRVLTYGQLA